LVVCGDFEPKKIMTEIKNRLIEKSDNGEIKRIYEKEEPSIVKQKVEQNMDVSMPLYTIGIKDKNVETKEKVKKHIAIEILLNLLIGESSNLYDKLYKKSIIFSMPSIDYEFADDYGHVLISGGATDTEEVYEEFP
jgi:predicted Zn-dependent peptidase